MADVRGLFCDATLEVQALLYEGKRKEAKELAIRYLSEDVDRPMLRALARDLLAKKGPGRPKGGSPKWWRDFAEEVLERRKHKKSEAEAIREIAKESKMSVRHIETCLSLYKDATLPQE